MGVRPPSDDLEEGPDVVEFGIAALDAELPDDVEFPVDAAALAEAHGDVTVPVDAAGNEISLERALSECHEDRFENRRSLLNALNPVFEAERAAVSRSLLARLRGLVPF